MFFGKPLDEKIEPAHAALGANFSAPARPVLHESFIPDQADNFIIRSVLQHAPRCPILIQASLHEATVEDFVELSGVEVVIPQVWESLCFLHVSIIREKTVEETNTGIKQRQKQGNEGILDRQRSKKFTY